MAEQGGKDRDPDSGRDRGEDLGRASDPRDPDAGHDAAGEPERNRTG